MGNCVSSGKAKAREVKAKAPRRHRKDEQSGAKGTGAGKGNEYKTAPVNAVAIRAGRGRVLDQATPDVTEVYRLGNVLGRGQFGVTRLAEDKATGEQLACKSISKRKLLNREDIEDVRREVQILHHLGGHPNITQLKGAFEDRHNVHLVMELCSGGELFDRIVSRGHYSEKDAAFLVRSIVKVVGHCHSLGVIHRDLKPENFLLGTKDENAALKSCDFGLSVFFEPNQLFTDVVGSPYYVAPEVLRRRYGKEADIWSCGVILYILLSGVPPFYGETEQQIFDAILKGHADFTSSPWDRISPDAKDCLKKMLQQDPKKRATADQVLQHPWMKEHGLASSAPLDNVILRRMQGFSAMNKLKQQALYILARNMAPAEVAGLRAIFQSIDKDGNGTITVEELKQGLRSQGSVVSEQELATLARDLNFDSMERLDADNNGTIDYEEFIAGTINLSSLQNSDNLAAVFEELDKDGSGFLTRDELETALKKYGGDVHLDIEMILKDVDKDGDGRIDYDEFCAMMSAGNEDVLSSKSTIRRVQVAERAVSLRPTRTSIS